MRTKTQMAFFQPKNQISIRKNQEKLNILSDLNSNFNYKLSSKMKNFSLEKRKITKIKNISSISEISTKLNQNQEKKESIKSISNQNKLLLSNIHFFKRKINNKIKLNSNHNSAIEDIKKNKYYFKNDYKYKNSHFDSQNSLPKIKVMRNPLQISLEKETNIFNKINSKS